MACALVGWLVFMALGSRFIAISGPTYDEATHLLCGYVALSGGPLLNWTDHPPLARAWDALPLLVLRPSPPPPERIPYFARADLFLYKNAVDATRLLNSARLWSLATWGALLFGVIAAWSFSEAGGAAAAAACVLAAFSPPLISNAALVTTDFAPAGLYALLFWLVSRRRRTPWLWAAAGCALALALTAKFSMIAAPAVLCAGLALEWFWRRTAIVTWRDAALIAGASAITVLVVYAPWGPSLFVRGLIATITRIGQARASFIAGHVLREGTLAYFPLAILLKTPPPTLLLALGAVIAWARRWDRDKLWLCLPPAAFLALALRTPVQIGYRHVLPVYPFLIIMAGWAAARLWKRDRLGRVALIGLLCWQAADVLAVEPYQLAYFSEFAGGPARGYRWLVDSNLDWGQDLPTLAEELRRSGNPAIYFSYFGVGDPSYYGIRYLPIAWYTDIGQRSGVFMPAGARVWVAVSATNLQGVYYQDTSLWAWLKDQHPIFDAGHSIFVYDLSRDKQGQDRLRDIVSAAGFKTPARNAGKQDR